MSKKINSNSPKIALVYDRVNTRFGGAEHVLTILHHIYPDAPLYTSVYDKNEATWAEGWDIRTSFLQHIPFAQTHHRLFVPLMPLAFESLDLSDFDIVISISSAEAKGVITSSKTLHICYLLTPTRYLWSHPHSYQQGIFSRYISLFFSCLRSWDFASAQRTDYFIPISKLVKERCEKYYKIQCENVIYPPFKSLISNLKPLHLLKNDNSLPYFLMVSRLVPYKNIDLAIRAAAQAKQPLIIVGSGPEKRKLTQLIRSLQAESLITIREHINYQELAQLYSNAQATLLLAEEDFGIVALEAQSFGCPVIVNEHSGASEVVINNTTGLHISTNTVDAIISGMYSTLHRDWNTARIIKQSEMYNEKVFRQKFSSIIERLWKTFQEQQKG